MAGIHMEMHEEGCQEDLFELLDGFIDEQHSTYSTLHSARIGEGTQLHVMGDARSNEFIHSQYNEVHTNASYTQNESGNNIWKSLGAPTYNNLGYNNIPSSNNSYQRYPHAEHEWRDCFDEGQRDSPYNHRLFHYTQGQFLKNEINEFQSVHPQEYHGERMQESGVVDMEYSQSQFQPGMHVMEFSQQDQQMCRQARNAFDSGFGATSTTVGDRLCDSSVATSDDLAYASSRIFPDIYSAEIIGSENNGVSDSLEESSFSYINAVSHTMSCSHEDVLNSVGLGQHPKFSEYFASPEVNDQGSISVPTVFPQLNSQNLLTTFTAPGDYSQLSPFTHEMRQSPFPCNAAIANNIFSSHADNNIISGQTRTPFGTVKHANYLGKRGQSSRLAAENEDVEENVENIFSSESETLFVPASTSKQTPQVIARSRGRPRKVRVVDGQVAGSVLTLATLLTACSSSLTSTSSSTPKNSVASMVRPLDGDERPCSSVYRSRGRASGRGRSRRRGRSSGRGCSGGCLGNLNAVVGDVQNVLNDRSVDGQVGDDSDEFPFYRHHNPEHLKSIKMHDLGTMDWKCSKCGALFFPYEQPRAPDGSFNWCCKNGKISVDLRPLPQELLKFYTPPPENTSAMADSKNFMEHIRNYNNAFGFASFCHKSNEELRGAGPYCYNVQGQVHHWIGDIDIEKARENAKVEYMQVYWLDPDSATKMRFENPANKGVFHCIMEQLEKLLRSINPFARSLHMLKEVQQRGNIVNGQREELPKLSLCVLHDRDEEKRRDFTGSRNAITSNEVAVVYKNYGDDDTPAIPHRAIHLRSGSLRSVKSIDPYLDAYTYPLLFPYGQMGWSETMKYKENEGRGARNNGKKSTKKREKVSCQEYYRSLFQEREGQFTPFLRAGKLTDQFACDSFLRIEYQRLDYVDRNQTKLRRESYVGLHDYLGRESSRRGYTTGQVTVLPSSFTNGPRFMYQLYADAMAMVRELGMPDYFITMTCNPKWVEIKRRLSNGQTPDQRKDIAVRVFREKLMELLKDLTEKELLGKVKGYCYTVEYQKRGLPHAHILVIMHDEYKPKTAEQVQKVISAEIPDPILDPVLYSRVRDFMIHEPCNAVNGGKCCNKDEKTGLYKCSKKFPKPFQQETKIDVDGFAQVRRRDNSGKCEAWKGLHIDNSWVVPYNPELLVKYNCHINTEVVSSVRAIKYLYKYVYKGVDRISLCIRGDSLDHNEVKSYMDNRYLCSSEAFWRIFKFETHGRSHTVIRLPVHEEDHQQVYFREGKEQEALARAECSGSKLSKYFELNNNSKDTLARDLFYQDIPKYYTWKQINGVYCLSKRERAADHKTIGRITSTRPNDVERDSIRRLLLNRKGCRSFKELRSINGVEHDSFKQALDAMGLGTGNDYWRSTLKEAVECRDAKAVRALFVTMCCTHEKTCAPKMWEEFYKHMIEDFVYRGDSEEVAIQRALEEMREELVELGMTLEELKIPVQCNSEILLSQTLDASEKAREMIGKLNRRQRTAVLAKLNAVTRVSGVTFSEFFSPLEFSAALPTSLSRTLLFFIDGPGGTGKTYVYNTLCEIFCRKGVRVACVAPTGIAASLLKGGRTVHSKFKIPINLTNSSTSYLNFNSAVAKEIRELHVLIWDEIGMTTKYLFNVVHRLFTDVRVDSKGDRSQEPFGGCIVIAGGDFRQTLPVVKRGGRPQYNSVCVKSSLHWKKFRSIKLTQNMRTGVDEKEHASYLLQVGTNEFSHRHPDVPPDYMPVPNELLIDSSDDPDALINFIFGEKGSTDYSNPKKLAGKAILAPGNKEALRINEVILKRLPGDVMTVLSEDSMSSEDGEQVMCEEEFLNSLTPSGMPPHVLNLKKGCVIMLLRNIKPARGLCNGTRLIVKDVLENLLDCEYINGVFEGTGVFVPKIGLEPNDDDFFKFKRVQFPVRLCYCMTIAKSQGQSLDAVGISLGKEPFAHGQIYTALSRCTSRNNLRIDVKGSALVKDGVTYIKNIVYHEVL